MNSGHSQPAQKQPKKSSPFLCCQLGNRDTLVTKLYPRQLKIAVLQNFIQRKCTAIINMK